MIRLTSLLFMLSLLSACACALDENDRAAGKPGIHQCFLATSAKAVACKSDTTSASNCSQTRH